MTASEIVSKLGDGDLAAALGVAKSTVSKWKDRGIPGEYWLAITRFAEQRGVNEITLETLASLRSKPEPVEARA